MWSKVAQYVEKYKLLNPNELYLVALSGGADSVALLLLLKDAGFNVHAAHCNFHLRGVESDRDEAFCEQLCAVENVPFHRAHFDTRAYAELHKASIEMAARELRYRWFEQLREDIGAAGICVAHHRDDSVETVILNMVRGTGVHGLTGIRPRNGYILRPLLCVSRAEIEDYLTKKGQKYVTDSTNLEDEATRNKVRHHIIPELQQLNGKALENIQRMTERVTAVEALLEDYKAKNLHTEAGRVIIQKCNVLNDYLLYELLADYGFNSVQASQIYASMCADSVGSVFSSADYNLLVDRNCLLVEPHCKPLKPLVIPETGTYILTVRQVEAGDWMVPYGMKGRKLLSDLMTDLKMSIFDKRKQLVVTDNQGIIVWVVGLRVSQLSAVSVSVSAVPDSRLAVPVLRLSLL